MKADKKYAESTKGYNAHIAHRQNYPEIPQAVMDQFMQAMSAKRKYHDFIVAMIDGQEIISGSSGPDFWAAKKKVEGSVGIVSPTSFMAYLIRGKGDPPIYNRLDSDGQPVTPPPHPTKT